MLNSRFLTKTFATLAAVIVLTASVVALLQANRIEQSVRTATERELREQVVLLSELARPVLIGRSDAVAFQRKVARLGEINRTRFTVIADDGVVVADSLEDPARMENHGSRPEVLEVRDGAIERIVERSSDTVQRPLIYLARAVFDGGRRVGYVRAARSSSAVSDTIGMLRQTMMFGIGIVALVACVLAFLVAGHLTRPLRQVSVAVQAMAAGDFSRRVVVRSQDEVGELAAACNSLAEQLDHRIEVLARERQEVVATLRSMVEGVVATDQEQRVLFINDSARRLLAVEQRDCTGLPLWELLRVQRITTLLEETLRSDSDHADEIGLVTPAGDKVLEVMSTPLRAEGDVAARGAVLVFHDITDLRRLEQVRRDFVSNVSHELKTPLTAVRGFVETLLDDPDIEVETRTRFLTKIQAQTHRLQALVADQLTLAKVESEDAPMDRTPIDLAALLVGSIGLVEPLAEQKSISIGRAGLEPAVHVVGDRELLQQVAGNLLDNAVKYTPEGGKVEVRLRRDGGMAVLEVEDSGIGLSVEDQQRVFERFYRVDQARSRELGGTGLGLSIVRNVTVAHGGEVSVESQLGRGSVFTVRLPVAG